MIAAGIDYRFHFAGLVLGIQDLPVLAWMMGHSSCQFVAVVAVVPDFVKNTGCIHSVAQGEGSLN